MSEREASPSVEGSGICPARVRLHHDVVNAAMEGRLHQHRQEGRSNSPPPVVSMDGHTHDLSGWWSQHENACTHEIAGFDGHEHGVVSVIGGDVFEIRVQRCIYGPPVLGETVKDKVAETGL